MKTIKMMGILFSITLFSLSYYAFRLSKIRSQPEHIGLLANQELKIIAFIFAPYILGIFIDSLPTSAEIQAYGFRTVLSPIFSLIFMIPVILIIRFSIGDLILLNVNEHMVLESLRQVLSSQGIQYAERPLAVRFIRPNAQVRKHRFDLDNFRSSIEVSISVLQKMALISIKKKRNLPSSNELLLDLKTSVEKKTFAGNVSGSLLQIFGSFVLFGMGLFVLILSWINPW